jgi:hypothetical protein
VRLDGRLGDPQPCADLLVDQPGGDEAKDLTFPGGQGRATAMAVRSRAPPRFEDDARGPRSQWGVALRRSPDPPEELLGSAS